MTVNLWSTTAATNATADSSINWRENQAPSTVNNSARAMMAAIAKWRDDQSGNLVTGGSSTAYTITSNQSLTPIADGYSITARMSATSGATPTLNVDSTGAKQIRGVLGTNIPTGALLSGCIYTFTYDSSDDAWIVQNRFGDSFNGTTAPDLNAIEALTGTGIPKRTGSDTWAMGAIVTDLGNTTADRLFGTNSSGVSGLVTLTAPLALSSGALSVDAASDTVAGKIEIATQAEMVTGTSTTLGVTPGRQRHHPAHPKAWANINQTGSQSINASSGVSSLTDSNTGNTTFTFSTAFAAATYLYTTGIGDVSTPGDGAATFIRWSAATSSTKSTTALGLQGRRWDGGTFANSYDSTDVGMAAFGDQ